ncbi:MAG: S-layer homology domain-containing protein, partial [Oscillospiraceae bacterium]|nr:S-layer homology domain-containing protein [Oscillospiraceae bacterium]
MRNLKKLLALVLTLALAFSLAVPSFALTGSFDDISTAEDFLSDNYGEDYAKATQLLIDVGIIAGGTTSGSEARNLNLDKPLSRGEFVVLLYQAMNGGQRISEKEPNWAARYGNGRFADTAGHWAEGEIAWAATYGYVQGNGYGFAPYQNITFNNGIMLVMNVLGYDAIKEGLQNLDGSWIAGYEKARDVYINHAYQTGVMGNLVAIDTETSYLNRAEAFYLFYQFLNSNTFSYDAAYGSLLQVRSQNGRPWALTSFGLINGSFTVITDGSWFGLPNIPSRVQVDEVNSGKLTQGRAVIQRPFEWDRKSGAVTEWDTYILSKEDTDALEIDITDVGRTLDITFEHPDREAWTHTEWSQTVTDWRPGEYHRRDIVKIYGTPTWASEIITLQGVDKSVWEDVNAELETSFTNPGSSRLFIDYNNDHFAADSTLFNDGRAGISSLDRMSGASGGDISYATYSSYASTFEALYGNINAPSSNNGVFGGWNGATLRAFKIWYNRTYSSNQFDIGDDWGLTLSAGLWENADIRVVYNENGIDFIFVENYHVSRYEYADNGNASFTGNIGGAGNNNVGHGKPLGNFKDTEFQGWEYYAVSPIIPDGYWTTTEKYLTQEADDRETGVITNVTGDANVYDGGELKEDQWTYNGRLTMNGSDFIMSHSLASRYNGFNTSMVAKEATLVLWHGQIVNILIDSVPNTYALVTGARVDATGLFDPVDTYRVRALFEDGSTGTYVLDKIIGLNGQPATRVASPVPADAQYGGSGHDNKVMYNSASADGGSGSINAAETDVYGDAAPVEEHIWRYTLNGGTITLYEIPARLDVVNPNAQGKVSGITQRFDATWGTAQLGAPNGYDGINGMFNTDISTVFVKRADGTYAVLPKKNVGSLTVAQGALLPTTETLRGNINDANVNLNGYAVRVTYIDTKGASSADVRTNWAIALDTWHRNEKPDSDGVTRGRVYAMLPDGTKTWLYCADNNNSVGTKVSAERAPKPGVYAGDVFEFWSYEGDINRIYDVEFLYKEALVSELNYAGNNMGNVDSFGVYVQNAAAWQGWSYSGIEDSHYSLLGNAQLYHVNLNSISYDATAGTSAAASRGPVNPSGAGAFGIATYARSNYLVVVRSAENGMIAQAVVVTSPTGAATAIPARQNLTLSVPVNVNHNTITVSAPAGSSFATPAGVLVKGVNTGFTANVVGGQLVIKLDSNMTGTEPYTVFIPGSAMSGRMIPNSSKLSAFTSKPLVAPIVKDFPMYKGQDTITVGVTGTTFRAWSTADFQLQYSDDGTTFLPAKDFGDYTIDIMSSTATSVVLKLGVALPKNYTFRLLIADDAITSSADAVITVATSPLVLIEDSATADAAVDPRRSAGTPATVNIGDAVRTTDGAGKPVITVPVTGTATMSGTELQATGNYANYKMAIDKLLTDQAEPFIMAAWNLTTTLEGLGIDTTNLNMVTDEYNEALELFATTADIQNGSNGWVKSTDDKGDYSSFGYGGFLMYANSTVTIKIYDVSGPDDGAAQKGQAADKGYGGSGTLLATLVFNSSGLTLTRDLYNVDFTGSKSAVQTGNGINSTDA